MLEVILFVASGMMWNNYEFFETAKVQYDEGYRWEYIGKKDADNSIPNLPLEGPNGKELVYFKLR
tara:strand:- start:3107 stop:3301 length:195 start_codon:yes stop_codon:yes gene_type:complete